MAFVIGDKHEGYDVVKVDRKREPWESRVWENNRIMRRDSHDSRKMAILYCYGRYSSHRMTGLKRHIKKPRF